jgi:hypothetical protein
MVTRAKIHTIAINTPEEFSAGQEMILETIALTVPVFS